MKDAPKFKRIEAGLYRFGNIEIRDQYSPDGHAHTRLIAKNGKRWQVSQDGKHVNRYHTLADAKEHSVPLAKAYAAWASALGVAVS